MTSVTESEDEQASSRPAGLLNHLWAEELPITSWQTACIVVWTLEGAEEFF